MLKSMGLFTRGQGSNAEEAHRQVDRMRSDTDSNQSHDLYQGLDQRQILLHVDEFTAKYGLEDIRGVMRKGAMLAHSPDTYWSVEGLGNEEIATLGHESRNSTEFQNTLASTHQFVIASYASAGILLGLTTESVFEDKCFDYFPRQFYWLAAIINCAPLIAFILTGCWWMENLNKYLARRGTLIVGVIIAVFCDTYIFNPDDWKLQLISRFLNGIGRGILQCTISIYSAECNSPHTRGAMTSASQFFAAMGQCFRFILGASSSTLPNKKANIITGCITITIVILAQESPNWCVHKGRMRRAYSLLLQLRGTEIQAARDLYWIYFQTAPEQPFYQRTGFILKLGQLVSMPKLRRALISSALVSIFQSLLSRVHVVRYLIGLLPSGSSYSIFFFSYLGLIPALIMIDRYGRRGMLMKVMPNMLWPMLLAIPSDLSLDGGTQEIRTAFFKGVFWILRCSASIVPLTYSAEIFPLHYRCIGVSLTLGFTQAVDLFFVYLAPCSVNSLFSNMFFIEVLIAVATLMTFLYMRETRKYPLEEIHTILETSSRSLASYRFFVELPYRFKRYILRRNVTLEPFEESSYNVGMISLDGIDSVPRS